MNIFVTSACPAACAQALDDKRIGKLLLESVEMLCLSLYAHGHHKWLHTRELEPRVRSSHFSHPCSVWTRQTHTNFEWLHRHAQALAEEFYLRFGGVHHCAAELVFLSEAPALPITCFGPATLTPFQNSARNLERGIDCTHLPVPESYREYLNQRWATDMRPARWTNRVPPEWFRGTQQETQL